MDRGGRVLVTDAQDVCGLAAIRCLAASGHRVTAAGLGPRAIGFLSRGCAAQSVVPDPHESLDEFADEIGRLLRDHPQDALIACRDETVYALSARREAIDTDTKVGLPDHHTVQRTFDRSVLAAEADKAGLPVPEQRLCNGIEDALDAARELSWPVLVKPIAASSPAGGGIARHPSRPAATEAALRDSVARIGSCIVQRSVSGAVLSVGGVAADGRLLGAVVSRYLRTWPPSIGQSSYTETIAPAAALIERVESLIAGIGWTGIFELELIEGPGGALHAIDLNPRPYGSIALARGAGVPLTSIWCDWLLCGEAPQLVVARPGVRYRDERRELFNLDARVRARDLRGAASLLRPRRRTVHPGFQLRDPRPGIRLIGSAAKQIARGEPGGS